MIELPRAAWLVLAIGTASALVSRWHRYRLSGCRDIAEMLRGELARLSLGYVQMIAAIAGMSANPLAWRRTPKFGAQSVGLRALSDTLAETVIGIAHLALIAVPILLSERIGWHMAFLAAPAMAWPSERELARQAGTAEAAEASFAIPATASTE